MIGRGWPENQIKPIKSIKLTRYQKWKNNPKCYDCNEVIRFDESVIINQSLLCKDCAFRRKEHEQIC